MTVNNKKFPGKNFVTPVGRLLFAYLEQPHAFPNSVPKYSVRILFSPSEVNELWEVICAIADENWPPQPFTNQQGKQELTPSGAARLKIDVHNPLRNGNQVFLKNPARDGMYQGMFFMNAGTSVDRPPSLWDINGEMATPGRIYSGCYGRLNVYISAFENSGNSGVTAYLQGVQFVQDGDRIESRGDQGANVKAAFAAAPLPQAAGYGFNTMPVNVTATTVSPPQLNASSTHTIQPPIVNPSPILQPPIVAGANPNYPAGFATPSNTLPS